MPETKQYGIIYADPPWRYDRKHGSGVAENHYPTMSMVLGSAFRASSMNHSPFVSNRAL